MKTKCAVLGALILAVIFSVEVSAWAGENWDKLSMGAKSAVSNIIVGGGRAVNNTGLVNFGNSIKTTNFGVGQRIGSGIDYSAGALQGARQSVVSGSLTAGTGIKAFLQAQTDVFRSGTGIKGFLQDQVDLFRYGETKKMHEDFMRQVYSMEAKYDELGLVPKSEYSTVKNFVDNYSVYSKMDKTNWDNNTKASFQKASNIVNKTNDIRNNLVVHTQNP